MRSQEVVVGNPECEVVVRTIVVVKAVCRTVRGFVGSVETFDQLFVRPELGGYRVVVCKADDLGDGEPHFFAEFQEELLSGKRISAVAISDKAEVLRKFFQMLEGHPHGHDAWPDAAVVRYLIADHGS